MYRTWLSNLRLVYVIYRTCLGHLASAYVIYCTCLRHLVSAYVIEFFELTGSPGYIGSIVQDILDISDIYIYICILILYIQAIHLL